MLKGRWLRLDGDYIFEIRAVDPNGKIDALYLNPKTINIAKAEATRDGSVLTVFVELRAPNYPGSTYTLSYDPEHDHTPRHLFTGGAVAEVRCELGEDEMKSDEGRGMSGGLENSDQSTVIGDQ